jgi:tRNA pseudouridine38-40 synthase
LEEDVDRNYRIELQYDGTGLHGWAKQDGLLTVEGCLEAAFRTVLGLTPELRVAGRTDAGVHARRQVANVSLPGDTDLVRLARSLNALTPPGIVVTRLSRTRGSFDARDDAVSRTYRYFLTNDEVASPFWAPFCWRVHGRLDLAALCASAALVAGRHDFTAFTPRETEHVHFHRLVTRCAWKKMSGGSSGGPPDGGQGLVYLEIEADAFLRRMVRALVGTMVEVGQGARTSDDFGRLLDGASREEAGITAPARGLFLWDVRYGTAASCRVARRLSPRSAGRGPAESLSPPTFPPAPGRS